MNTNGNSNPTPKDALALLTAAVDKWKAIRGWQIEIDDAQHGTYTVTCKTHADKDATIQSCNCLGQSYRVKVLR